MDAWGWNTVGWCPVNNACKEFLRKDNRMCLQYLDEGQSVNLHIGVALPTGQGELDPRHEQIHVRGERTRQHLNCSCTFSSHIDIVSNAKDVCLMCEKITKISSVSNEKQPWRVLMDFSFI